jgi:sRNA-binding regulator protein Hfq
MATSIDAESDAVELAIVIGVQDTYIVFVLNSKSNRMMFKLAIVLAVLCVALAFQSNRMGRCVV